MGILGNFNVYGLMVLPLAMLIRGKRISLSRLVTLMMVTVCLQFAESILRASVVGLVGPSVVLEGVVIPLIETCFFSHLLTDSKAIKVFHLQDAVEGDDGTASPSAGNSKRSGNAGDMAAALAVVWCLCYFVFFRWGEWYHSMSSLGFEPVTLISGAEAFCQLLATLSACRVILASGGSGVVIAQLVAARAASAVAATAVGSLTATAAASVALYVAGPTVAAVALGNSNHP